MEVILLERIERLGQMGDVVVVKDGFARNFLLPKNKALRANKENLEFFEKEKINLEAKNLKLKNEAEAVSEKIVVKGFTPSSGPLEFVEGEYKIVSLSTEIIGNFW